MAEYIERETALRALQRLITPARSPAQTEMIRTAGVNILKIPAADVIPAQRWISVWEQLPKKSGRYLVMCDGHCMILPYSARYKIFNSYDSFNADEAGKHCIDCTHWMPMPEPPKEIDYGKI